MSLRIYPSLLNLMADDDGGSLMFRFHQIFFREFLGRYREDLKSNNPRRCGIVSEYTQRLIHRIDNLMNDADYASVMISENEDVESASTCSILFCVLPYVKGYLLYNHTVYDGNSRAGILADVLNDWRIFRRYCRRVGKWESDDDHLSREAVIAARKRQTILQESFLRVETAIDIDDVREEVLELIEYMAIECRRNKKLASQEMDLLNLRDQSNRGTETTAPTIGPRKPWTMRIDNTNLRARFASQVFRPDIAMPTISLEEFAELEISRFSSNRTPLRTPASEDSENIYRYDAANEKADEDRNRIWDDWKDDNPRGSGNKLVNLG